MPEDDMGKGEVSEGGGSITEETFRKIAQDWKMSVEDAKKNVLELLQKEVGES
ncbi:hypothetical protein HY404_00115 [Candidatus Microgenomates bacterium]|nr:hypothetical protein [Candidatus Microgenomates bacterium]